MLSMWNNQGQKLTGSEILKDFRKKVNMTKTELAFECNIPLVTYEEWENGTVTPPLYIIKLIAKALGIEVKDKLVEVQTNWLIHNNYFKEDFEIGDNWVIALNKDGDISLFELENDYFWLQLLEDPDIAWREGDSVFRCAIATINPTVQLKILEEITFNNPLIQQERSYVR